MNLATVIFPNVFHIVLVTFLTAQNTRHPELRKERFIWFTFIKVLVQTQRLQGRVAHRQALKR